MENKNKKSFMLLQDSTYSDDDYVMFVHSSSRHNGKITFPKEMLDEIVADDKELEDHLKDIINPLDFIKMVNIEKYNDLQTQFQEMALSSGLIYLGFSNSCIVMLESVKLLDKVNNELEKKNGGKIKKIIVTNNLKEGEIIVAPLTEHYLKLYPPNKNSPVGYNKFEDHCFQYNVVEGVDTEDLGAKEADVESVDSAKDASVKR